MPRVQVAPTQGPQAIRPTAAPIHQMIQPKAPDMSEGQGIAKALQGFSSSIAGLVMDYEEAQHKEANYEAEDRLNGMTLDEAKELVNTGVIRETESPYFAQAFEKQFGLAYASQRKRDLLTAYHTEFDKANGDLDQWLSQAVQDDQAAYAGMPTVYDGIREGMGGFLDVVRDQHAEFQAQGLKEAVSDRFFAVADDAVLRALSSGQDPHKAVRSLYQGHKERLGLSYAQMDDAVIEIAKKYASEGDVETVTSLLGSGVKGADGTDVGSFLDRTSTAAKARQILTKAETARTNARQKAAIGGIAEFQLRASSGSLSDTDASIIQSLVDDDIISPGAGSALFAQNHRAQRIGAIADRTNRARAEYNLGAAEAISRGMGYRVQDYTYRDEDGRDHTFKAEDAIQATADSALGQLEQAGAEPSIMAATLASMGVSATYTPWKNVLSDGHLTLHQAVVNKGADGSVQIPKPAQDAYDVWKSLAEFPALRARHASDTRAVNTFNDAEVLERNGMDANTALIRASQIDRSSNRTGLSGRVELDRLESAVRSASSGGWFDGSAENGGAISREIEAQARIYMDLGLPMETAMEEAKTNYQASHTTINGVSINTRNAFVPPDFDEMSSVILNEFAEKHGEDPSDLTLLPTQDGGKFWLVVRKGSLVPHENWEDGGSVSVKDMQRRSSDKRASTHREIRSKNAEATAARKGAGEMLISLRALPEKHRLNHLKHPAHTGEYKKLQDRFGRKMYPDGGLIPHQSEDDLDPKNFTTPSLPARVPPIGPAAPAR